MKNCPVPDKSGPIINNANIKYLNFIKHNRNMIENHLQSCQFEHPYKMSLLKSHQGVMTKPDHKGIYGTIQSKKQVMMGLRTIDSDDLKRQTIIITTNCNGGNIPGAKSLSLACQLPKHTNTNNNGILHSRNMITRDDILQIVDEKNKQISQQLLKQRHNFSQIVYKNNSHHHKIVTGNNVRYGGSINMTAMRGKERGNQRNYKNMQKNLQRNHRYVSQSQSYQTLEEHKNSNLLLPSIKKRSQSYRHQAPSLQPNGNTPQTALLYSPESAQFSKSINQLRRQFQEHSDGVKMYKKVQRNNMALKVKQLKQKNLQSYYEYENAIAKKSQLFQLSSKKGVISDNDNSKIGNQINNNNRMINSKKKSPPKALFNDNLLEVVLNTKQCQPIDSLNLLYSNAISDQEEQFIRQIAGKKSEEQVRKLLGSTMSPGAINKNLLNKPDGENSYDDSAIASYQSEFQTSNNIINSLSPAKRVFNLSHLKSPRSLPIVKAETTLYDIKLSTYREFAFRILFTHKKIHSLTIREMPTTTMKNQDKFRFYVGQGNNSLLIHSLMKRRFWWTIEDDPKKAHFVWTQLKINSIFQKQSKAQPKTLYYKAQTQDLENNQSIVKKIKKSPNKKKDSNNQQKQKKNTIFKPPFPEDNELKVFTTYDKNIFQKFSRVLAESNNADKWDNFNKRKQFFPEGYLEHLQQNQKPQYQELKLQQQQEQTMNNSKSYRVHNHFQFNHFMGNKKGLFYNLRYYYHLIQKDVYDIIPLTFHIRNGQKDPQYSKFLKYYKAIEKRLSKNGSQQQHQTYKKKQRNIWIVKPGQNSNRGQGIQVFDELYQLNNILKQKSTKNPSVQHTYIVQKYIQRPLLYKNRKFDIRHYFIITRMWGRMKAYFFGEGYIRTSSYEFDLNNVGDTEIHLTNDAIQKYCNEYGKYEEGNKLSYMEFQRYLDQLNKEENMKVNGGKSKGKQRRQVSFANDIYPQMRNIAIETIKACYIQMDPNRNEHNFQVFGMDFMIDRDFKVWLIEINTNPCLELSSKLLQRIIPSMVEQTLRLSIDILFPPPYHYPNSMKHMMPDYSLEKLKFEMIFDQDRDGKALQQLFNKQQQKQRSEGRKTIRELLLGQIDQEDQTYESNGSDLNIIDEKPYSQID